MLAPDDFDPEPGRLEQLEPRVWRILAPNPSPMTYRGTNTYLVGTKNLAVIDPGPQSEAHLEAILSSLRPDQSISHILVTHSHLDHSPLAPALSQRCGAPIYAFGDSSSGRSRIMQSLIDLGMRGGGEGIDRAFRPDVQLRDGAVLDGGDWQLEVLHTPGHLGNHLCFALGDACFTADHVMGWASSLVSPPDGDLTDFMASCARLMQRQWRIFYPGHGAPITEPAARLAWLISHRKTREAEILAKLQQSPARAIDLTRAIYLDTPEALLPAAKRNVFAHLVDLTGRELVHPQGAIDQDAVFAPSMAPDKKR